MGWFYKKLTREQRVEGKVDQLFDALMDEHDFEFTYEERVTIVRQFEQKIIGSLLEEEAILRERRVDLHTTQERLTKALKMLQNG